MSGFPIRGVWLWGNEIRDCAKLSSIESGRGRRQHIYRDNLPIKRITSSMLIASDREFAHQSLKSLHANGHTRSYIDPKP